MNQPESQSAPASPGGLMDKFAPVAAMRAGIEATGIDPTGVVIERMLSTTEAIVEGRPTILAGTNNYLGMTFNPACIAAGQQAMAEFGTGTTGSRMANGTFAGHTDLEAALAEFFGMPYAMVFSTGYAANLGTLAALLNPSDAVLLDGDAHASLYDGCRMSGAQIFRFKHNDPESLDKRLTRLGEQAKRALIVVEGLYSVLGDLAPLREFAEIKRKHGAWLLVDEAHSLGAYGQHGRGLYEELAIEADTDFVVGTFSKSLGAMGGFCVSPHPELKLFRYTSRPFIFTASPSPATVATVREALNQIQTRPELKHNLWRNAQHLHGGLSALGLTLGAPPSPVVAVRCTDRDQAFARWRKLLEIGVYCNLMAPPASPDGSSLLRLSVSAAHTPEQIDRVIAAFAAL
ncbi:MAG: aminotransferase class I/II-fold pyridoxal phosphate-dependent enzyme [Xanthomonadaceae bacterium]|nr:aminotransferase class I/II-fold pyridoxal phosphate-dependent enzyme [Xanthomonadaceae bacterium]